MSTILAVGLLLVIFLRFLRFVLTSESRTQRLAVLIAAWRGGPPDREAHGGDDHGGTTTPPGP